MQSRTIRKILSWALVLTMILTMLPASVLATATGESEAVASEASAELFAIYNYLEISFEETADGDPKVSSTSATFLPDSEPIFPHFYTVLNDRYADGSFDVFNDPAGEEVMFAGIAAYEAEVGGNTGAWASWFACIDIAISGDLKALLFDLTTTIDALTIGQAYSLTYDKYTITVTRKTHSTGSGGGSGVGPSTGDSTPDGSVVVLSTYYGLNADGAIVDMAHVLHADGTTERVATSTTPGFTASPCAGCVYLYSYSYCGEMCFAAVPAAYGTYDDSNEGETVAAVAQTVTAASKAIKLGSGRNYFADGCNFIYVYEDSNWNWKYAANQPLQTLADTARLYAVIDGDGAISTLYIIGAVPANVDEPDEPQGPVEIEGPNSVVVLRTYAGLNADGAIVSKAKVLYADGTMEHVVVGTMTGYTALPTPGCAYLYGINANGETCFATVPTASGTIGANNKDETYLAGSQTVPADAKSITLGSSRNYFADECKFIYVSQDSKLNWDFTVSDKLQDLDTSAQLCVVIDADGCISTLYILGFAVKNTIKDSDSLIFIAHGNGTATKLDKDGKRVTLYCYDAFIDGVKVEGFVSTDEVSVGFYENEYDSANDWYILAGNAYNDAAEDIKVTGAEPFSADRLALNKYIVVDGNIDVELTANTKYASAIDGVVIESLDNLKFELQEDGCCVTIYIVYDGTTGDVLYLYVTEYFWDETSKGFGNSGSRGYIEPEHFTLPLSEAFNGNELLWAVNAAGYSFDTTVDGSNDVFLQIYENGIQTETMDPASLYRWLDVFANSDLPWSGNGVKVEVTANENGVIYRIDITQSFSDIVTAKVRDKASTPHVDERKIVTSSFVIYGDDEVEGFDEIFDSLEEGDIIVIIPNIQNANGYLWSVLRIYRPTVVTGDVTYSKPGYSVSIDGVNYKLAMNYGFPVVVGDEDVTLYLDEYGYAIAAEGACTAAASTVVLSTYMGLDADGAIVNMAKVLYADGTTARVATGTMTGYTVTPAAGCVYLYDYNDDGEMCFASVPAASGTIGEWNEGETFAAAGQTIAESAKSITLGQGRNFFADDCKFIYVAEDGNWNFTVSDKLQDLSSYVDLYAVIDAGGNISTLYIIGAAAKNTIKDSESLIFITGFNGEQSKLDKDGRRVTVYAYDAFIDGVKVEGFISKDNISYSDWFNPSFYVNEYDTQNGWYILADNEYDDTAEDIQVTYAETLAKSTIYGDKYITVDGSVDIELTSATKYASAIDEIEINSLADLKFGLIDDDPTDWYEPTATIYVVYDNETGAALYVYLTAVDSFIPAEPVSITVSTPPTKTEYIVGEETLDVTGGKVTIHYNSGGKKVIDLTADMVTGFDNTILGTQTLTVTYAGFTNTFAIELLRKPVAQLFAESNIVNDHIVLFVESTKEITTQVLHIALYSEAGQMLDYIIVPTVKPFTATNVVFDDDAAVKTAKVFLWDSLTTTTPIADAVEVTIR